MDPYTPLNLQMISDEEKKKLYSELAEIMISAMEKGELGDTDSAESAQFIIDNFEKIKTKVEVYLFLEQLYIKWPLYKDVFDKFELGMKTAESTQKDQAKLAEVQQKLNQLIQS
jgi:hypothetical protein